MIIVDCGRWKRSQTEYVFDPGNDVAKSTTHNQMGNNAKQERGSHTPQRWGLILLLFILP